MVPGASDLYGNQETGGIMVDTFEQALQRNGEAARSRARAIATLCVGGMVLARSIEDRMRYVRFMQDHVRRAEQAALRTRRQPDRGACEDDPHDLRVGRAESATLVKQRDDRDINRADSPLKPADDAHLLDTSEMSIEAAFQAAKSLIDAALSRNT